MEDQNRRDSPRYSVNLYTEQVEHEVVPTRILNLSESGFLLRGGICAGAGGIIRASFKVHPSSGEMSVSTKGKVIHSIKVGNGEYEYGVKIDEFGSKEEEMAYRHYVRELAPSTSTVSSPSSI
jgi:hypothetical protein